MAARGKQTLYRVSQEMELPRVGVSGISSPELGGSRGTWWDFELRDW